MDTRVLPLAVLIVLAAWIPDTARAQVTPPSVTSVTAEPASSREGATVTLAATVHNPSGAALLYTWDPGDGSPPRSGPALASIVHLYPDDGTFTVTLTVDDGSGGVAEGTGTVSVTNVAPEIAALAAPAEAARDEPVTLEAVARDPGSDDVLTYRWDFGDGGTASGPGLASTTHRFTEPGVHSVRVVVEDGDGGRAERTVLVPVEWTHEFTLSGAVDLSIAGGFDPRPGFVAIPGQGAGGTCKLTVTAVGEGGHTVMLDGSLRPPIRLGTYEVVWYPDRMPGTFTTQYMLDCGHPGVDCGPGFPWRAMSRSGSIQLTRADANRVEGRVRVRMGSGERSSELDGVFTAVPSSVGGVAVSRGEGTCFSSGVLAVESVTPEPDGKNVEVDRAEVRVALTERFDRSSLSHTTFRLEYRLPDRVTGGVPAEAFHQVEGVLEATSERSFRFVPAEPLLDGVIYRATITGGDRGLRGAAGERMDDDRSWRFSTMVEPEEVRVAVFQVARNAPLVPGKTTLTRVYVDWKEREDVHPGWQVVTFPAAVEVEVDGRPVGAYPPRDPASLTRPDRFSWEDRAHARNSVNFFGWEPSGTGGASTIVATVEPKGQEAVPPRRFESAPLRLEHHTASPRLRFEARHVLVGPWEDGVPPAARAIAREILEEGAEFTVQNFPVVDVEGRRVREVAVSADGPAMFSWTQETGLRVYPDLSQRAPVPLDDYVAKEAYDIVALGSDVDMLILFMPSGLQPALGGYAYRFPIRTVGIFIPESAGPQTVQKATGTVAHEFGHAFGLRHRSACPKGEFQSCLNRGREGSDEIEGFRLALDGSGGSNKSKTEGNAEAPTTRAVLSLMYPDAIGAPGMFIMNDQYAELMRHPELAWVAPVPELAVPASPERGPYVAPTPSFGFRTWRPVGLRPDAGGSERQAARSFLVSGLVLPGGEEALLDPIRIVDEPPPGTDQAGEHILEVLDEAGEILHTASFGTVPVAPGHVRMDDGTLADPPPEGESGWFWVAAPASDRASAVVVKRDDRVLTRMPRTPNAPTVSLAEPAAGVADDLVEVAWSGADADGDPVAFTLSYSPDGETGWRTVGPRWTTAATMRLDRSRLPEGPRPTLRVVVTDGFNRGEDRMELEGR